MKNGIFLIRDWGESYLGVYLWGELIWTSYDTVKRYNTFDAEFDMKVCELIFRKQYFLKTDYLS